MSKAYTSNLTFDQYELIKPLIPLAKPGGRPREVCMWSRLNAIFYIVTLGCKWRDLPGDFPSWQTVYTYFLHWRQDGTWLAIHDRLHSWTRVAAGRDESPSEAILVLVFKLNLTFSHILLRRQHRGSIEFLLRNRSLDGID